MLISDGVLNEDAMKQAGGNLDWLLAHLNEYNIHSIEEVFVAIVDSAGNFYIQKKKKRGKK